ncbi:MAG: acyl carrier protein [Saprospiraceae bacterium]|nr:acyl carrier protein [Saprospiraceae bacterium]
MREELIAYLETEILHGEEEVLAEDDLLGSGLVDSMGMMKFIAHIEEEYEITIPPQDLVIENFMTIAAIEEYVKGRSS